MGKRVDTYGFYPLNSRFPLFLSPAKIGERRLLRNRGTAEDSYYRVFRSLFAVSDTILLHIRFIFYRARHDSAARFVSALLQTEPAKITCTKRLIRRCHALQRAKDLRDTVMSRLRRVARMCSSTLSVNCEKAEKDTQR